MYAYDPYNVEGFWNSDWLERRNKIDEEDIDDENENDLEPENNTHA